MIRVFFFFIISLILCILLIIVNFFFSLFDLKDKDKDRNFECGFLRWVRGHFYFSMRYFLLTVVFVVFDVEIVLLFPGVIILDFFYYISLILVIGFFLLILYIGLIYEVKKGVFDWTSS